MEIGGCVIKSRLKMSVGIDSDGESEPLLAQDQVCGEVKPICNCDFISMLFALNHLLMLCPFFSMLGILKIK